MRIFVSFVLPLAALLGACGEDGPTGGSSTPTPTPTPTAASTNAERIAALEQARTIPALNRDVGLLPSDTNSNGVRDDIDTFIAATAHSAAGKQALIQMARSIQATLTVNVADEASVSSAGLALTRSSACVFSRASGASDPLIKDALRLQSVTTNTRERLTAYMRFNKASDGSVSTIPTEDTCE